MVKAVVLHSGGLDSTLCLLMAIEKQREVVSVGIDYGQEQRIELDYAQRQCQRFGVRRRVLKLEWDKPETHFPRNRSPEDMRESVSPAFLPGRNILFLGLGVAEARGIAAQEVWIGVNAVDYSGYPDCRPEFVDAYRRMLELGVPGGPAVMAPLQNMTKPEIAIEAARLGLKEGDTWSCYTPQRRGSEWTPCNECDACILHNLAWSHARARER